MRVGLNVHILTFSHSHICTFADRRRIRRQASYSPTGVALIIVVSILLAIMIAIAATTLCGIKYEREVFVLAVFNIGL